MKLQLLFIFVVLCSVSIYFGHADRNPGLVARLNRKGLQYAANIIIDTLSNLVTGERFPDFSGVYEMSLTTVYYKFKNIVITEFEKPLSYMTTNKDVGVTWDVMDLSAAVKGDWSYDSRIIFPVSDAGTMDLKAKGIIVSATATIGHDGNGKPTISLVETFCSVGVLEVEFNGGASWLYNLFKSRISNSFKGIMCKAITEKIVDVMQVDAANFLKNMTLKTVFWDDKLELDYSLTLKPTYGNHHVETYHLAEMYAVGEQTNLPFQSPPIPDFPESDRMAQFIITNYVMNSLGYVLHEKDYLQFSVNSSDFSLEYRDALNTSCAGLNCIGKLVPQLPKLYPNTLVEFDMKTTAPPFLNIDTNRVSGVLQGKMSFYAAVSNESQPFLFTLSVGTELSLIVDVTDTVIKARVADFNMNFNVLNTEIGEISERVMKVILDMIIKKTVIPEMDKMMSKGLAIPSIAGVHLKDIEHTQAKDAIIVNFNVLYAPELEN